METSKQPMDPFCIVFAVASCFSTRCPVDLTRVLVWYRFYFLRFLLICQLEGLHSSFILKWFFFLKYFRTLSQNSSENWVFRVFLWQELQKWFLWLFPLFLGWRFLWHIWKNIELAMQSKSVFPWKQYWKIFSYFI